MTQTDCHYDRHLGERVTHDHRQSCTDPDTHRGCAPCTAHHCTACGQTHATNDHPVTCLTCTTRTKGDLTEIRTSYALLATEALEGGRDGRLVAAAPIPGGTAAILIGPTVRLDMLRVSREMSEDHRNSDPLPPLAVLVQWEDLWRDWLGHTPGAGRPTIGRAIAYLLNQIDYMAQQDGLGAPEFAAFTRQVRVLRAHLERALHDEHEPEQGVECFECCDQLVRRFRRATRCRHRTPARDWFRYVLTLAALGYPKLGPTPLDVRAALRPCGACDQGGIEDPSAGQSWECLGCGKEYDPGEYATAVRRDLLTRGPAGDGWTHITMAADAASTLTGGLVPAATVRKWMDRNQVAACCLWTEGRSWGQRLVFWPDVADAALDMKERQRARVLAAKQLELRKARKAKEKAAAAASAAAS